MNILFQSRIDLFDKPGGDTIHLMKTKEAVERLGVTTRISCESAPDLVGVDIVHLFNLDWVRETYLQAKHAVAHGVPVVLTPIHHPFRDIEALEATDAFGIQRIVNPLFPSWRAKEHLKNLYRAVFDPRKIPGTLTQWVTGMDRQFRYVLENAAQVLPNTALEQAEIEKEFGVSLKGRTQIVPAGVDPALFLDASPSAFRTHLKKESVPFAQDPFYLCVGRIEPRKNQLRVIEAAREVGVPLVLIGRFNHNHPEYAARVRRQCDAAQVYHIPEYPHEKLGSAYAAATAHVQASWFETTSLVNLEAALANCVVIASTRGYGSEYVKNGALYCDPDSVDSIALAMRQALKAKPSGILKERILANYTWDKIGKQTVEVYQRLKDHKSV